MKKIVIGFLSWFLFSAAFAAGSFTIKKIEVRGLQGLDRATVVSHLPIKVGEQFSTEKSVRIIQSLYRTGFFDSVSLDQDQNTLVVAVKQRPIISRIQLTGNKTIPNAQLTKVLRSLGVYEGQILDPSVLHQIKMSLQQEYISIGHYNAVVNVDVVNQPRNRAAVSIKVNEGAIAKVKSISFVGNKAFSDRVLRKQMHLSTTNLFSFLTRHDRYSKQLLDQDLTALGNFYLDHGYLKFDIVSKKVNVAKDNLHVAITVHLKEGEQYRISGYKLAKNRILKLKDVEPLITIEKGQYFSRKKLVEINKNINKELGNKGYANADVQVQPKVNTKTHTVFLTFVIKPGRLMYVRHVTFSGNDHTNDTVLRHAVDQLEGAPYSTDKIEEAKSNLFILPSQSISNVDIVTKKVKGEPQKIDVEYQVKERSTASLNASLGYSELNGATLGGGFTQNNWLGTGKTVSLSAQVSKSAQNLNYSIYNPYYTKSGIGRSFNIYTKTFDADRADISNYATDLVGASMGYTIPITNRARWSAGYGFEYNYVKLGSSASTQAQNFKKEHGTHFYQAFLNAGWSYNGWDRSIFPTKGLNHGVNTTVTVPVGSESLEYYKINYDANYFHPLTKGFIAKVNFDLGYGNGYDRYNTLPFFKNYYAGGIGSIRGYEAASLGPKDSNGDSLGGKFVINGSVGLITPNWISESLRTYFFVDGGNVYDKISLSHVRFSTGVEIDWRAPIGLLNFSLAKALNPEDGDSTSVFQFNIGTSF